MLDSATASRIASEAQALHKQYDYEALSAMLVAEERRIRQDQPLTLSDNRVKDLIPEFLQTLGKLAVAHREFTTASVMLLVPKATQYLATQGVVDPANVELTQFIISIFVALVISALMKQRKKKKKG